MEKKELRKVTKRVYEEYGFVKKGRYFYLDLEDVLICSGFNSMHGITYLAFNFSVKAVNSEEDRMPNDMFEGYDSIEIQMFFDRNAQGYHRKEIVYENWDEESYEKKLNELLHYYFDPFRKDALNHIRRCWNEIGYVHEGTKILVQAKTREYLGIL